MSGPSLNGEELSMRNTLPYDLHDKFNTLKNPQTILLERIKIAWELRRFATDEENLKAERVAVYNAVLHFEMNTDLMDRYACYQSAAQNIENLSVLDDVAAQACAILLRDRVENAFAKKDVRMTLEEKEALLQKLHKVENIRLSDDSILDI